MVEVCWLERGMQGWWRNGWVVERDRGVDGGWMDGGMLME